MKGKFVLAYVMEGRDTAEASAVVSADTINDCASDIEAQCLLLNMLRALAGQLSSQGLKNVDIKYQN